MNDALDRIAAAMPLVLTGVVVAAALLAIVLVVRVVRKAGYSPWWAIGIFVPGVNLVLLVMFATVRWPLERRLDEAERWRAPASPLGEMTPDVVVASAPPPARPSPGPDSGSLPVHGARVVTPDVLPGVAPPTFTPLQYPAGYGSPPVPGGATSVSPGVVGPAPPPGPVGPAPPPGSRARRGPAGMRPDAHG